MIKHDVANIALAQKGINRIEWAQKAMPVLILIKERFEREKPLKGIQVGACLHVTTETAVLAKTLVAGGAKVAVCASNPLSTQDDVAAALAKSGIPVFAKRGENTKTYYSHISSVLEAHPQITLDDGADLVSTLHGKRKKQIPEIIGGTEETTTGVIRLRAMAKDGVLAYPIIAVNDAKTKHLFDNRYGTGQSTVDGIIRATNRLLAGSIFVVVGYGWCGRGVAMRAKGMGARVIVCEVDPLRALEAVMDGFDVMPLAQASKIGDIFCTLTGDTSIINKKHFKVMKDGAILANSGHFDVEIDKVALKNMSKNVRRIRDNVDEYALKDGRKLYLLGEGRLINLAAAEGHPSSVMDMSFANQALCVEYLAKQEKKLAPNVYTVPEEIDKLVAKLKLQSMGIKVDKLTAEQKKYLTSWELGT